jgi:hypothetical protein
MAEAEAAVPDGLAGLDEFPGWPAEASWVADGPDGGADFFELRKIQSATAATRTMVMPKNFFIR